MKGFPIQVKNNLLEPKHVRAMGAAIWEYIWCLDKMTSINEEGTGKVLGGKPIKIDEIADDLGRHRSNVQKNLRRLVVQRYLNIKRQKYGLSIEINKAFKKFRKSVDNSNRDIPKTHIRYTKNTTSMREFGISRFKKPLQNKGKSEIDVAQYDMSVDKGISNEKSIGEILKKYRPYSLKDKKKEDERN